MIRASIHPDASTSSPLPLEERSVATCHAVILSLSNRRFVIVQPDAPQKDLWPIDGGWEKVRTLQPGDQVIYKGVRATVRALEVYR